MMKCHDGDMQSHANLIRPNPYQDASMAAIEGTIRLLLACAAFVSLIYCYRWGISHWSSMYGRLAIGGASMTNLPAGVYQATKGSRILFGALWDIAQTAHNISSRPDGNGVTNSTCSTENLPSFVPNDTDWMNFISQNSDFDMRCSRFLIRREPAWRAMPYPKELGEMESASALFNAALNGPLSLDSDLQRQYRAHYIWLSRFLFLAAFANLSLYWTGTSSWRWLPLAALAATVAMIFKWLFIIWKTENRRFKNMGCWITGHVLRSRRLLNRRLALFLTEPFGGPLEFLAKARAWGDDATHFSSLFRPSPLLSGAVLFLPITSWAAKFLPDLLTHERFWVAIASCGLSLFAAMYFWLVCKANLDIPILGQRFPANSWFFRKTCDNFRKLYD
jgi:hypothetical protein